MNSLEIANILNSNSITNKRFKGVYAADTIKNFDSMPYCIVVNTDKYGEPGTHWVAIYVHDSENIEYFDSFAEQPVENIEKILNQFKNVKMNNTKLQSIWDNSCGAHVIYYIIQKCQGKSLQDVVSALNSPYNDSLVKLFVYDFISHP
jgi:hypothetical protein